MTTLPPGRLTVVSLVYIDIHGATDVADARAMAERHIAGRVPQLSAVMESLPGGVFRIGVELLPVETDPCRTCGGARWVDDEGWQPDYPEQRRGQLNRKGDYVGLLPCPACNEGGEHATIEEVRR